MNTFREEFEKTHPTLQGLDKAQANALLLALSETIESTPPDSAEHQSDVVFILTAALVHAALRTADSLDSKEPVSAIQRASAFVRIMRSYTELMHEQAKLAALGIMLKGTENG